MLLKVILHRPKWVFVALFLPFWLGTKQRVESNISLSRVTRMPVAMGGDPY